MSGSPSSIAAGDDKKPAALQYDYGSSSPERLTAIKDPVSGRQVTLHYNHAGDSCYTGTRSAARGRTGTRRRTCCARSTARTALGPTCGTRVARLARLDDPGAEVTDFGYNTDGLLDKIRDPLVADWVAKDPAGRDSRDHPTYVATRRCCIWVNVT